MYTYVNKVDIAANQDQNEVMLSFKQIYPQFKDEEPGPDGQPRVTITPISEEAVSLIMTKDFAKRLKDLIDSII